MKRANVLAKALAEAKPASAATLVTRPPRPSGHGRHDPGAGEPGLPGHPGLAYKQATKRALGEMRCGERASLGGGSGIRDGIVHGAPEPGMAGARQRQRRGGREPLAADSDSAAGTDPIGVGARRTEDNIRFHVPVSILAWERRSC